MEFEKLVKHLTAASRDSMEKAVALASSRSHHSIELEHWLHELIISSDSDTKTLLSHFEVDEAQLISDLVQALETHKTGNQGFPKIGPDIARLLFESWILASSEFKSLSVRPSHIWLAILDNLQISLKLADISAEFGKINAEDLRSQCAALLESQGDKPDLNVSDKLTKTAALDQFAINMTELARSGKYDKILGRDDEIRQMIDILCRRKQNNPILTGEAGVGKTAVVEGLAARLAANDVPSLLRGVELYSLDMGLLQAGAGVKGEFENRLVIRSA
jgi:type VI secretion system protein VasG